MDNKLNNSGNDYAYRNLEGYFSYSPDLVILSVLITRYPVDAPEYNESVLVSANTVEAALEVVGELGTVRSWGHLHDEIGRLDQAMLTNKIARRHMQELK